MPLRTVARVVALVHHLCLAPIVLGVSEALLGSLEAVARALVRQTFIEVGCRLRQWAPYSRAAGPMASFQATAARPMCPTGQIRQWPLCCCRHGIMQHVAGNTTSLLLAHRWCVFSAVCPLGSCHFGSLGVEPRCASHGRRGASPAWPGPALLMQLLRPCTHQRALQSTRLRAGLGTWGILACTAQGFRSSRRTMQKPSYSPAVSACF